ncbi:MAG: AEC family transporter [Clostridia bacterium]|nr:AEC family transporter [Clostridia bacterium]MBR3715449.1 AEC family transporter [Clostridia bacterium]
MSVLSNTLNQTLLLFLLIAAGYILVKAKIIPADGARVLSRLENTLIIPALVMGTFISNFTVNKLSEYGRLFLLSFALFAVILPIAVIFARLIYKDSYRRKIALYGLSFANFGFMGNAVVLAIYGNEFFAKYAFFVIPLWIMIYLWGVPSLLLSDDEDEKSTDGGTRVKLLKKLKPLVNPMFIAMLIGMIIGITGLGDVIPKNNFFLGAVNQTGACMSVLAMLITGMTIANTDILYILKNVRIYVLSAVRLLLIPILFILAFSFVPQSSIIDKTFLTCAMCAISMPLGLNTIVVPGANGKDTRDAAGMALISHTLAVITIPMMFMLFEKFVL